MKLNKYGMRLRPCSLGCQPDDFAYSIVDESKKYHNFIFYKRELTEKEIEDYEMDYLGVSE